MTTRLTLGSEGAMANADHLIGAFVIVAVTAMAEVARAVRLLNLARAQRVIIPFLLSASLQGVPGWSIADGVQYGGWNKYII